jgi:hypothetical protein
MKLSADFPRQSRVRATAVSLLLALSLPRARAENGISYKYEDYREAGGRIGVQTQGALIEQSLGTEMRLKLEGVIDAIAGATPDGRPAPAGTDQVPLSELHERRKAWSAEFSRQFPRINVALGFANSRESDYVSNGWSVNTLTDFNQKNTTVLIGVAGTDDDVDVRYLRSVEKKRGVDVIVGLTQLLNPETSVSLNLTWGTVYGFLEDPYRLVEKSTELFPGFVQPVTYPESRPDNRDKVIVLGSINRAFPETHGAIEASYRFYHDTFGTNAHTLEAAWFQRLGSKLILRPSLRLYDQSAADFYHYRIDGTNITPTFGRPPKNGPFYSSDFRLSALRTSTVGLKAIYQATDWLALDAAYEYYDMRGRDGVTPQSAYCRAKIATFGVKITW